jgi:hypothetical protein
MSSHAGFMPRGTSQLKFEGNMLVGWPRRWFCQLLEYEKERRCQENLRGKIEDDPPQNCSMVEAKYMQVLT